MYQIIDELPDSSYDIVVLGGGFAGAAASRQLTAQGFSVLVLEARDRLGGRMWSEENHFDKHNVEWGGAFMLDRATYPLAWREIDEAELPLAWGSLESTELIWVSAGQRRTGPIPVPIDELESLERLVLHIQGLASQINPSRSIEEQEVRHLDVPWPDLLSALDLGPHTRDIWRSHIVTIAGDDWEVPSALPLLSAIATAGSVAAATLVEAPHDTPMSRTLGPQLAGGTGALYRAIMDKSSAQVLLNCTVQTVRDDGATVTVSTDRGVVRARVCVSALPISTLNAVSFEPELPGALRQLASEGVSGQAEKATVYVSGCPRPFYGHGIPPAGGFATASTTWHEGDRAIVVGFTSDVQALDLDDKEAVQEALGWYVPGIKVEGVAWHDWTGDKYSRGTWSYLRPGQTFARMRVRRVHGRVAFAGSDFDARLGVEGALYTARLAADECASLLGV